MSVQTESTNNKCLLNILESSRFKGETSEVTHTGMGGNCQGKFKISNNNYESFLKAYYQDIFVKKNKSMACFTHIQIQGTKIYYKLSYCLSVYLSV